MERAMKRTGKPQASVWSVCLAPPATSACAIPASDMRTASHTAPSPCLQAGLGSALSWRSALTSPSSRASFSAATSPAFRGLRVGFRADSTQPAAMARLLVEGGAKVLAAAARRRRAGSGWAARTLRASPVSPSSSSSSQSMPPPSLCSPRAPPSPAPSAPCPPPPRSGGSRGCGGGGARGRQCGGRGG
eukprot:402281-Rhodomonas_salina.1